MTISINFVRDWEDIQIGEFQRVISNWGFESQALKRYLNASPCTKEWEQARDEALITWFNFQHRRIPAQPREVVPNPSLVCPPELLAGWSMLQEEVKNGTDLTPRLSRKIEDADYNDGMLNDWGFYHFHLGTTSDPKHPRLKKGTPIVLLAIVDESEFYPVIFVQHDQWGNKEILERAVSTFPKRFERFCINGFTDIACPGADENIVEIRKSRMNPFYKIGNKLYCPPGMGLTCAGTSIAATIQLDSFRRQLRQKENQLREILNAQHCSGEVKLIRDPSAANAFLIELKPSKN